jgi:tetratricopeptide (TPR) repeat protein
MESRANRLAGIIAIKRGQYPRAVEYLERSLKTDHFENCYESWFLLGYAWLQIGDLDKAHEFLVRSSRKRSELDHSLYYLAQVEILRGDNHEALRILKQVPLSGMTHPNVFNLMAYTLRQLGEQEMAGKMIDKSFLKDPLNFVGYVERLELAGDSEEVVDKINFVFDRRDPLFTGSQIYIETAIHYIKLGDYGLALKVLDIAEDHYEDAQRTYPFLDYYRGYCLLKTGEKEGAMHCYRKASMRDHTYVNPYRPETLEVLENVIAFFPEDAVAYMYYGDLLYYLRRHGEALAAWEKSYDIDPLNFRVSRNLAIGKYVESGDPEETTRLLEESFEQSGKNLRIFAELEALYILQSNFDELEKHYDGNLDIIHQKGDYALKAADFYISRERFRDAGNVLKNSYFSAAERALGKPVRHTRYVEAQIGMAGDLLEQGRAGEAITELLKAYEYPSYLNEAKVNNPVTTRLDYFLAMAYKADGQKEKAEKYFQKAVEQDINPVSVAAIYKARALKQTGKKKAAETLVEGMLEKLKGDGPGSGSAVSDYLQSLAYEFLDDTEKAEELGKTAVDKLYNVAMEARYESSYISSRKLALE